MKTRRKGKVVNVGNNCRWVTLSKIDGRTQQGAIVTETRRLLVEHVGGAPSVPQQLIIERCALLTLRCSQIEAKFANGNISQFDTLHYLSWANSLGKLLNKLGITEPIERDPSMSLREYLTSRASQVAAQVTARHPPEPPAAPVPDKAA